MWGASPRGSRERVPRWITQGRNFDAAHGAFTAKMGQSLVKPAVVRKAHGILGALEMETVMLVCAVFASLALGVLVAYGVCQTMFRMFRVHAVSAARNRSAASQSLRVQQS